MTRFEQGYSGLGKLDSILAASAAHHRLLYIHPFLDGNGRVARLMSYTMLRQSLDTGGVWSVARGLARNVEDYKAHLNNCDLPKRNDLDRRGNLSEESLLGAMALVRGATKGVLAWRQHTDSAPTVCVVKRYTVEQSAQAWKI